VAKSKPRGADASVRRRRHWLILRRWLTALFVTVGIFAQFAWFFGNETDSGYVGPTTGGVIVGSVGLALLFCAVLLYVPEGIQRARQTHRDNQEFKDRFR
jgi:hypothetical protein